MLGLAYRIWNNASGVLKGGAAGTGIDLCGAGGDDGPAPPEVKEGGGPAATVCGHPAVVITGDHKLTRRGGGQRAGHLPAGDSALTGETWISMPQEMLEPMWSSFGLCPGLPEHKMRIVKAWQKPERWWP